MELHLQRIIVPTAAALGASLGLFFLRAISGRFLHRWARLTGSGIDEIIIKTLRLPSLFWCLAIGLYIGVALSDLTDRYVFYINRTVYIVIILSATVAASNLAGKIFRNYIGRTSFPIPATGLAYGVLKGTILVVGFVIALSFLGVSIAPLITAMGVGGLAVALALQDTLSNLFAGMHILMEKAIRVGDFIRLEAGQEGYVEDITWRTTRIRMLPNNVVVIPNNKLSQSVVTNYFLPEKRMSLSLSVGVSSASDPDRVETLLLDEANKAIGEVDGMLAEPEPSVRLIPGFGQGTLDFTLTCQVREFIDQFPVQHELRKRIIRRFREEDIETGPAQKVVYLLKDERDETA